MKSLLAVAVAIVVNSCTFSHQGAPPLPHYDKAIISSNQPSPGKNRDFIGTIPSSSKVAKIKYGILIPGKPGYVLSPYDSGGHMIDAHELKENDFIKDPYTGSIFLMPATLAVSKRKSAEQGAAANP